MAKLVSKTYGDALFELAVSEGKLDELFAEAKELVTVFSENQELMKLLGHPKVVKEEKISVIENIFKGNVSEEMTGFLTLIVKKDRYKNVLEILEYFISEVKEYKKIGVATVTTVAAIDDNTKSKIEAKLKETTQYETFEICYEVDESLVGGMIIRIGDKVVDSSIKTKIAELSKTLYNVQLS